MLPGSGDCPYNPRMIGNTLPVKTAFPLKPLNTFGIDARAAYYLAIDKVETLFSVHANPVLGRLPRLVLGGGSNLLFVGDFPGLVLHMRLKGRQMTGEDDSRVYVTAAAGESWHEFVLWTLGNGWGGLENLSLIPGTVGAAPVQNIGAYGAELQETFHALRVFDFEAGKICVFNRQECRFAYRNSLFKEEKAGRYAILTVTFALPKKWEPNLSYSELAARFSGGRETLSPGGVSRVVMDIRRGKLPDPAVMGNAGSFFKNPTVTAAVYESLKGQYPQMPAYRQPDGSYRIAAGWLIDQCGWKGRTHGRAGVCETQALVLVNLGGAAGKDVAQLAQLIRQDVEARFGLCLEPEPVFAGQAG